MVFKHQCIMRKIYVIVLCSIFETGQILFPILAPENGNLFYKMFSKIDFNAGEEVDEEGEGEERKRSR